jgi:hypothetical protein
MEPRELIAKYRSKGVLLDTNLMVLLAVGSYKRERISSFKRTDKYTPRDFTLVIWLLEQFQQRITTPHILTEADNLTRQLPENEHAAIAVIMAPLIDAFFEIRRPSADAARHPRYADLGLADCMTITAAEDVLVITDDFRLARILTHLGRDAININHLRTFN